MKRGAPDHPKMRELARQLKLPGRYGIATANGIMERLWHFTAKYCPQGDIGRFSDEIIADACGLYVARRDRFQASARHMVGTLVSTGWLNVSPAWRLVVHDWNEHCDDAARRTLKNRGLQFVLPENVRQIPEVVPLFPPGYPTDSVLPSLALPIKEGIEVPVQPEVVDKDRKKSGSLEIPVETVEDQQPGTKTAAFLPSATIPNGDHGKPSWVTDEKYGIFVGLMRRFRPRVLDEEFAEGYRLRWINLKTTEKLLAIKNLRARVESGEDGEYVKHMPDFLVAEWKRGPKAKAAAAGGEPARPWPKAPTYAPPED